MCPNRVVSTVISLKLTVLSPSSTLNLQVEREERKTEEDKARKKRVWEEAFPLVYSGLGFRA